MKPNVDWGWISDPVLPGKSFDFGCNAGFDLSEFLVSSGVPQLVEDDEGDDQDLEQEPEDPQRDVLHGHDLRGLILKEGREETLLGATWEAPSFTCRIWTSAGTCCNCRRTGHIIRRHIVTGICRQNNFVFRHTTNDNNSQVKNFVCVDLSLFTFFFDVQNLFNDWEKDTIEFFSGAQKSPNSLSLSLHPIFINLSPSFSPLFNYVFITHSLFLPPSLSHLLFIPLSIFISIPLLFLSFFLSLPLSLHVPDGCKRSFFWSEKMVLSIQRREKKSVIPYVYPKAHFFHSSDVEALCPSKSNYFVVELGFDSILIKLRKKWFQPNENSLARHLGPRPHFVWKMITEYK